MPEFRKMCDVSQGYNYKKDVQTRDRPPTPAPLAP